jgi:flagella basal body P-ring formation protein FlgA
MKIRYNLILVILLITAARIAVAGENAVLEVCLPAESAIKGDVILLGNVGKLGGDETLAAEAGKITLGRLLTPQQEITVDRQMILSRLACNGIAASQVIFSGAEKVTVKQLQRIIKSSEFVELADAFLKKDVARAANSQWYLVRTPKDFVVPSADGDISFTTHLFRTSLSNQATIRINVFVDGKEAGVREIVYRFKYDCRTAITTADIPVGTVLSADNIRIEKTLSDNPEAADWKPPYGLVARRRLPADTVLTAQMLTAIKPPVVVERNKAVIVRFENPGLVITAIGKAMQDGRTGEYIKIKNVSSQKIIVAKVNEDGTVEPVL